MSDWTRYRRAPDVPLEVMRAHFERHVYHRHAHDTYSFGVTETGTQAFTCRGAAHTSAGGMVMAFNPDDAHDGHATERLGFTYRMVHLGPELVADVLRDVAERPAGRPLFAEPVIAAPHLARRLLELSDALLAGGTDPLRRYELLTRTVWAMTQHGTSARHGNSTRHDAPARVSGPDAALIAGRARALLDAAGATEVSAAQLAQATGRSRFTVYRAFQARYGLSPSDYHRQGRLRSARRMLATGLPAAQVAALAGFADQSHLNRWFVRCFGITPGAFQRAAIDGS